MNVVIIDYGSGNIHSTQKSFEKVAEQTGDTILVTQDISAVAQAERIVLPGVGAFADCMHGLSAIPNMIDTLHKTVLEKHTPFLGICVGMQLLANNGYEHTATEGLGWIEGNVTAIEPRDPQLKIPHMGWNSLEVKTTHPLFTDIQTGDHAYFVHSYQFTCKEEANMLATVDYSVPVTAAIAKGHIMGTQFHPEKSQKTGMKLIHNFLTKEFTS